ncbi:hypothetical protein F8388_005773 [Cannabis sativa]|uniref:C2H2-type domain-containing protein n=1 Tax=Cannabis sativa TaxID=3483 RepID=A0A7J6HMP5_CANSA|nr:hypothetical protein F8388_005773 [Cannabis sativa]
MEKHKCKLCFRSFSNGRALGGHMRSHMLNLPIPPKQEGDEQQQKQKPRPPQTPPELSDSAESASSSEDDEAEEEEIEERELIDEKGVYYGLRENPKRSIRLGDPEFSFAVVDAGSVVLQDRESETESSKNPTRRRSKRARKSCGFDRHHHHHQHHHHHHHPHHEQRQYHKIDHHHQYQEENDSLKKIKLSKLSNKTESWAEPEPVSSVSDATTEEDVAFCLMMLSRDKWRREENQPRVIEEDLEEEEEEDEEEEEEEEERSMDDSDQSEELKSTRTIVNVSRTRCKYKCETCKKVFRSYQALGGHRASHKKIKASNVVTTTTTALNEPEENAATTATTATLMAEKKVHQCPVCFRVFSSGQALGGHKRSHVTGSYTITTTTTHTQATKSSRKVVESLLDLNLPAPVDEDEVSQIEHSAVSDAEFVNSIRH